MIVIPNMIDLGTLGGSFSSANEMNNKGQIVGGSSLANFDFHAFLWQNGEMTDLGTLGGSSSVANGINNRGQVVGDAQTVNGELHAFLVNL